MAQDPDWKGPAIGRILSHAGRRGATIGDEIPWPGAPQLRLKTLQAIPVPGILERGDWASPP